ncbi:rhamnose-binding lectin-like isoform X2 [Hydra vulgaris]|uniref:Rhamnose-binding lectin-like isoform X2 n=1 Tax=Hydra vulgaris TaxID=6087 RepID=A0ABM4CYJ3_HYDVU
MSSICPGANYLNLKCDNKQKSLDIVQSSCSNKSYCIVKAANTVFGDPCIGTYKYLEVEYNCKSQVVRACEWNELKIDCNADEEIEVVYANYGRTLAGICPGSNEINTKCNYQNTSLDIVQSSCSAKSSCVVKATNAVFGDPCVGTFKYLEVRYNCKPQFQVARACEGNDLIIDCNAKGVIEITNANYGRTMSSICPGASDFNSKCDNKKTSLEIVQRSCSYNSACTVKATNAVFGDPCVGTYKYLEVEYTCKSQVVRACEWNDLKIDCNANEEIEVVYANYGRTLAGICPGSNEINTKCNHQKTSYDVVQSSCSAKSSCVVKATNAVFGDPCVGTFKYLEVRYNCKPKLQIARACEGNDLKIDCNGKGKIEVVNANYGRTLPGLCPAGDTSNTKCDNKKKSIEIVQYNCSSKPSCIVKAANEVFGDPCFGTYKYLEVQYTCG